jgi:hypothetical protein
MVIFLGAPTSGIDGRGMKKEKGTEERTAFIHTAGLGKLTFPVTSHDLA